MQWSETIRERVAAVAATKVDAALARRLFGLLDLTRLQAADDEASMADFFQSAQASLGSVAAVCVLPRFVRFAADQFANTAVRVASVANFPDGSASLAAVLLEIGRALADGANEVDVVFPYQRYLAGEREYAHAFVQACKAACGDRVLLKVILETGALPNPAIITDASYDVLAAGADFIKTSTGNLTRGATLEVAAAMLLVIKQMTVQHKRVVGFKASGGIRDARQAAAYLALADQIMGPHWAQPATFRLGASQLANELLKVL